MDTLQQLLPADLYNDVMKMFNKFSVKNLKKDGKPQEFKGHVFTPNFSPETVEFALEKWSMREGDVLLASYPKTGTNWMVAILRTLLYDEKELILSKQLPIDVTLVEAGGSKYAREGPPSLPNVSDKDLFLVFRNIDIVAELKSNLSKSSKFDVLDRLPLKRRVLGTHVVGDFVNLEMMKKVDAKVIYILRNPKDQMVSMYHFVQKIIGSGGNPMARMVAGGWNAYFDHVVNGKLPIGCLPGEWYPHHILSWYKHRDNKNVRFVYYEDLKTDFKTELRHIAEFLKVEVSDEKICEIEERCSMDGMKKDIGSYSDDFGFFQKANLRKGEVGGWKEYFTVAQSELIDQKMNDCLKNTDVTFKYT